MVPLENLTVMLLFPSSESIIFGLIMLSLLTSKMLSKNKKLKNTFYLKKCLNNIEKSYIHLTLSVIVDGVVVGIDNDDDRSVVCSGIESSGKMV